MRRPWLVAQREFLENVRTKGFWIGIFVLPLLLTLSVVMPAVLEKLRKPRPFAVVDHSGWVLEALRPTLADGARRFTLVEVPAAPDKPVRLSELRGAIQRLLGPSLSGKIH